MNTRQKLVGVSSLLAGAIALSGCAAASAPAGNVDITFWHSASGAAAEVVDQAVADFNATHEGEISVTAVYQGTYDDAITKLASAVQAQNLPDIMQVNDANTQYMIDTGLSVAADELDDAATTKLDAANFVPVVRSYYTIDDRLRSVPFQISQPALFINPELAAAAGLDLTTPPATIDEMYRWAEQITAATGAGGFVTHINPWWVEQLTASAGLAYCTPDNGVGQEPATAFELTDPAQIAQWEGMQNLYRSQVAVNVGGDGDAAQASFANGDAGILMASSAVLGNISAAASFVPVVAPMPLDSADGAAVPGGNSLWVLGSDVAGAREQASYAFAQYLASDEVQQANFTQSGYLPATTTAVEAVKENADAAQAVLLDQLAAASGSTAGAGCHSGALQQVRMDLQQGMESALVGDETVAESFGAVEQNAPALIAEYEERVGR